MSIFLAILAWIGIELAVILMIAAVVACLIGIPGATVVFIITCILSISTGWQRPPWWMLIFFLVLTIIAEAGDNVLSAWGTKKFGGTTKAAFWAMVGGFTGVIVGGQICTAVLSLAGPFGTIVGATVGTLACGMAGGFLGGYWYELRQGTPKDEAKKAGWGAFLGRAAGGLLKAALAAVMVTLTLGALFSDGGPMASKDEPEPLAEEVAPEEAPEEAEDDEAEETARAGWGPHTSPIRPLRRQSVEGLWACEFQRRCERDREVEVEPVLGGYVAALLLHDRGETNLEDRSLPLT